MSNYNIVRNTAITMEDDTILRAFRDMEAKRVVSADLTEAFSNLEEVWSEHVDAEDVESVRLCRQAESAVVEAYEAAR